MAQWAPMSRSEPAQEVVDSDLSSHSLAELRWPDVGIGDLLVVPLGASEQHGPHLPIGTDSLVAAELAHRLAKGRSGCLVAPVLSYGSSGEHAGFPGTLSIGQAAVEMVLVELVRSADSFRGAVFVSGHGGNAEPLSRALRQLITEGRRVMAWAPSQTSVAGIVPGRDLSGDHHAGLIETSIVMHLRPDLVLDLPAGHPVIVDRPLEELIPVLRRDGVSGVSADGVLGDPRGASAELGSALLDAFADDLVRAVECWSAATAESGGLSDRASAAPTSPPGRPAPVAT